ncbi:MAG: hypothetical protein ACRDN1_19555 [Trebonia sp.]
MTEIESLTAEVRQLRAEVARLHTAHTAMHIRHGWMGMLLKDLSTNPYTQYKVHMWGAIYWLINANLATDYGAMSAAEAAFGEPQPPPIPLEPPLPSI